MRPKDFNAARHTCCAWMKDSLDVKLLSTMLKRGGWWAGVSEKVSDRARLFKDGVQVRFSDSWFLSCQLARECALSGDWVGNGLADSSGNPIQPEALLQTSRVDFSDLASGIVSKSQAGGLIMTTSVCGRFLMVADGIMIYVYEFIRDKLVAWTSIRCPHRVLATAMDTTAHRYDVAALLDGRTGFVCHLQGNKRPSVLKSSIVNQRAMPAAAAAGGSGPGASGHRHEPIESAFSSEDRYARPQETGTYIRSKLSPHERTKLYLRFTEPWFSNKECTQTLDPESNILDDRAVMQVESGQHTTYRHLCANDDPPRSVSICPQRQCVAFGCGAGLELHWVDALTGQGLNRWFPLTGPSDHLYFLPPRRGVDDARTLRLISSAAHPFYRPAIGGRLTETRSAQRRCYFTEDERVLVGLIGTTSVDTLTDEIVGNSRMSVDLNPASERAAASNFRGHFVADTDHYRAAPLSEGHHILFIDPDFGELNIGTDAPLGSPRRLSRRIRLLPPTSLGSRPRVPRVYAASSVLGGESALVSLRVVAVYGHSLVLYSIPGDVLEYSRREQSGNTIPAAGAGANSATLPPMDWPEWSMDRARSEMWPMSFRGTIFGTMGDVVDLAVNDNGALSIWAFSLSCQATAWTVRGKSSLVMETEVLSNGLIGERQVLDEQGDTIMFEAPVFGPYDGLDEKWVEESRAEKAPSIERQLVESETVWIGGHGIWVDESGIITKMSVTELGGLVAGLD